MKRKRIIKFIVAIAFVVCLVVGGALLFVDSKLNKISYNANENTPMKTGEEFVVEGDNDTLDMEGLEQRESGGELPTDDVFADEDIINILLLGTDMKLPGTQDPGRCDMTMVCSLNKTTGEVKLISFERAIGVPIPGYEDEKLNSAFQYGGGEFMQETITNCFLVDLTGYIHVGYEMFPQAIDAIGGLDIELDQSEVYNMSQYLAYEESVGELKVGMNHLNGIATYSYARLRDADDDWVRQGRTRNVVAAMVEKLKTLNVKDLNSIINTVLPMVDTNLTKAEIRSLILAAPKFINAEVSQLMMPHKEETWGYVTGRGAHMLGCDYSACAEEIKEFIYG